MIYSSDQPGRQAICLWHQGSVIVNSKQVCESLGGENRLAKIGYGYGSEWHLLRYLGRHRERLNQAVLATIGGESVEWRDAPLQAKPPFDAEWKGVDFLGSDHPVRAAWLKSWPQTGNVPNWDAVGTLSSGGAGEWLLVEAKAHLAELGSSCGAKPQGGLARIHSALDQTKLALGVELGCNWLEGYYQYCNRVAMLHFLQTQSVSARLLFIYFTGEKHEGWSCPADAKGWSDALKLMDKQVGLSAGHPLARRIHRLFLPVTMN
jgi:hypothetical protein